MITPDEAADRDRALQALPLRPILVGLLLAIVGGILVGSALGLGGLWVSVRLGDHFKMPFVMEIVRSTGGVTYSALLLLTTRRALMRAGQSPIGRLALPAGWHWVAIAILLGLCAGVVWVITDCALPPPQIWSVREITEIPWEIALVFGAVVNLLIGPMSEEMLYRGVLYPVLEKRSHLLAPALISSAIFTLAHTNYYWSPSDLAIVFGVGLVASEFYRRYRTIVVPLLFHSTINLIMLLHSLRAGCP